MVPSHGRCPYRIVGRSEDLHAYAVVGQNEIGKVVSGRAAVEIDAIATEVLQRAVHDRDSVVTSAIVDPVPPEVTRSGAIDRVPVQVDGDVVRRYHETVARTVDEIDLQPDARDHGVSTPDFLNRSLRGHAVGPPARIATVPRNTIPSDVTFSIERKPPPLVGLSYSVTVLQEHNELPLVKMGLPRQRTTKPQPGA